jgi:hypothetical protein
MSKVVPRFQAAKGHLPQYLQGQVRKGAQTQETHKTHKLNTWGQCMANLELEIAIQTIYLYPFNGRSFFFCFRAV